MPEAVLRTFTFLVCATFASIFLSRTALVVTSALVLVSGFWLAFKEESRTWRKIPLLLPFLGFFAAILLSILFAEPYPFAGPLGKIRYLLLYFPLIAFFSTQPKISDYVRKLACALCFLLGTVSVFQFLGILKFRPLAEIYAANSRYFHATGFLAHHTIFSFGCVLLFHVVFGALVAPSTKRMKWLNAGALAFIVAAIFMSFSRGAWLSCAISTALVAFSLSPKRGLIAVGAMIVLVISAATISSSFRSRALDIRPDKNPERFALWRISWEMFKDAPVLGKGFHSFATYRDHYRREEDKQFTAFPWETHSLYFDLLGGTGIVGLSAFLWLALAALINFWKAMRTPLGPSELADVLTGYGSFLAALISNLTDTHFYSTYGLAGTVFLLAMGQAVVFRRRLSILQ